jgi:hypothetical protein
MAKTNSSNRASLITSGGAACSTMKLFPQISVKKFFSRNIHIYQDLSKLSRMNMGKDCINGAQSELFRGDKCCAAEAAHAAQFVNKFEQRKLPFNGCAP